jgi:hypothetical protein
MARSAALVCALALVVLAACAPTGDDYMNSGVRQQVEQLKIDAAQTATTNDTLAARLPVFAAWSDAYALSGGFLPVHVTFATALLNQALTDGTEPDPWMITMMDLFIEELAIKDERPDAIGSIAFSASDPVPVDSWQTIEQIWTAGSMGMQPGGALLLGRQLQAYLSVYQWDDPAGDNFVSIRSSNPAAKFEKFFVPLRGMHGGFRTEAPMPAFRLAGTALEPGDTVTVTYGDSSSGSRGYHIQTDSTDRFLLPIYLDLEGRGNFLTPVWPALELIGIEPRTVRAVAPSVVATGEPFELALRSEDRYFNRATGSIPAYQVLLNGEQWARVEASNDGYAVVRDLAVEQAGVYRFEIRSEDGSITGRSNPIWVQDDPPHRIFWGETHGHTDFAEGQGSPEQYFRYGRDDARLDFFSLSEHDLMMDASEWQHLQELSREYTEEGRLVTFLGYEWTVERDRGGHHNVLFRTPDRDIVGIHRANRLPELYRILAEENAPKDVLIIPHAHMAGDWKLNDPELEKLVEVYSMHGTFEWFGNYYLQSGFETGFIAASDDHRAKGGYAQGRPRASLAQRGGLAAVFAPTKTSDAIFDAMRSLAAYATSGQRIILSAELNGNRMGTRQESTEPREISCRVMGTAPIDHIDLIKNGEVVFSQSYSTAALSSDATVLIGFESSSEVFGEIRDNPRGYRIWQGTLTVEGARVVGLSTPGFENVYTDRAEIDPAAMNLIRFRTETRGRRDTMLLRLEGASAATSIRVRLEPTTEYGAAPPLVRPFAELPARDFRLRLSQLDDGRLEHLIQEGQHTDRVSLQVIDPEGALDQDFSYTDLGAAADGDYYYLRVTQIEGGRAWSSPFWVGRTED